MIYATLTLPGQAEPLAELSEGGWRSPTPGLARYLDVLCNPWEQSPAIGDPVVWAAHKAAELLDATAVITPTEGSDDEQNVVY